MDYIIYNALSSWEVIKQKYLFKCPPPLLFYIFLYCTVLYCTCPPPKNNNTKLFCKLPFPSQHCRNKCLYLQKQRLIIFLWIYQNQKVAEQEENNQKQNTFAQNLEHGGSNLWFVIHKNKQIKTTLQDILVCFSVICDFLKSDRTRVEEATKEND